MDFSVILPTYNRLTQLKEALQSIIKQDYADYEIIVVNDGSTDGTEEYLKTVAIPNLRSISQENRGPAAARNAGLEIAQGKYIAYTDDDCIVPSNWLSSFKNLFESTDADIIGGAVYNSVHKNIFSETSQHITNFFVEYLNRDGKQSPFLTSNNIAYRADVIKKVGGFDERFKKAGGEERALNWKILCNGGKSVFSPDIVVEHNHNMNFRKFVRQQINYGRGAYILHRVVGKELNSKSQIITFRLYFKLVNSFFKRNHFKGILKLLLFLYSQIIIVIGFVYEACIKH